MFALGALGALSFEHGITTVTEATDFLADLLANQVLATSTGRHSKRVLVSRFVGLGRDLELGLGLVFFALLCRVARALGAANVLAIDAGLAASE